MGGAGPLIPIQISFFNKGASSLTLFPLKGAFWLVLNPSPAFFKLSFSQANSLAFALGQLLSVALWYIAGEMFYLACGVSCLPWVGCFQSFSQFQNS